MDPRDPNVPPADLSGAPLAARPPAPGAGRAPLLTENLVPALRRLPAYVYLADLLRGRRVLEIGCGDGVAARYLAQAGAAHVHALDHSPPAIEAARRHRLANLSFAVAADYGALELEDRSFDVVCVPAGGELARWIGFLEELRRVLRRDGHLVLAAPSADHPDARSGFSYHDLAKRLEPLFGPVRMVGVSPFVGMALVEYADSEAIAEMELDTSLAALGAGRDPVIEYVAVAGLQTAEARPYMVVELPPAEGLLAVADLRGEPAHAGWEERLRIAEGVAAEALARLQETEAGHGPRGAEAELRRRLARLVEERSVAEAELEDARARLAQAHEETARVAAEAARELAEARREAEDAAERADAAEEALVEARAAMERDAPERAESEEAEARAVIARLELSLREQDEALGRLTSERQELQWRVSELEGQLAARADAPAGEGEAGAVEVLAKAAAVHEKAMREVRAELDERDAYVEELRRELDEIAAAQRASAGAAREADQVAARLEAELRAVRTRMALAEGELLRRRMEEQAHAAQPPSPTPDPALESRIAELEAALVERTTAVEKATARWKEAEAKTDDLWRKIGELQKEIVGSREQAVENARAQRQAAQLALTRAVDEASRKMVSVQDNLIRTERERAELEKEVVALRTRVADGSRERAEALAAVAMLRDQVATAQAELAATQAEVDAFARQARDAGAAQAELAATQAEVDALARQARDAAAAQARKDEELARLGDELARLRAEATAGAPPTGAGVADEEGAAALRAELAHAQRDADRAWDEVDAARAALLRVEDELAEARDELQGLLDAASARRREQAEAVVRLDELADAVRRLDAGLHAEERRLGDLEGALRAVAHGGTAGPPEGPVADPTRLHAAVEDATRRVGELVELIRRARDRVPGGALEAEAVLDQLVREATRLADAAEGT